MWEMGANTWITSALSITSWHLKGYLHCSLLFELNQGEEKQDSQMPLVHFTWNVYWTPPVLLGGGRYPRVTGEDAEAQRGQQWFSVSLSRANLDPYQPLFTSLYMNSTWIDQGHLADRAFSTSLTFTSIPLLLFALSLCFAKNKI